MENKYFSNLDEIELKWKELKQKGFPQTLRDQFWGLCVKGRIEFWKQVNEDKKQGLSIVKKVPAYERAIVLLEEEHKYKDAIRLCEEANKLGIDTDWYTKRIAKLSKK